MSDLRSRREGGFILCEYLFASSLRVLWFCMFLELSPCDSSIKAVGLVVSDSTESVFCLTSAYEFRRRRFSCYNFAYANCESDILFFSNTDRRAHVQMIVGTG